MIYDFEPGDKVFNPANKDWGIGQVQSIIKDKITKPVPRVSINPAACILLNTSGNFIKPILPDKIKKHPRKRKKIEE